MRAEWYSEERLLLTMRVPFTDLKRTFEVYQDEYEAAALRALRSGWYILGSELESFEREFADLIGTKYCIGVGCGQDALTLGLRSLGIGEGDEVIVAGNTYIATVLGVTENGANPIFVDCNEYFQIDEEKIEQAITSMTKAVLITNLYGQCCDLPTIKEICDRNDIFLVEDCAQSHGATFGGIMSGTAGILGCFSFYPTKPLGAFGDAGAVVTDDLEIAERLRMLRNYGSRQKYVNEVRGVNSRLDEIQAAVLRVGLAHLKESAERRREIAERYLSGISNPRIILPRTREGSDNVFHIFPILCPQRDDLKAFLEARGIQTQVHYPIPPHKAECYFDYGFDDAVLPNTERYARELLSLPIYVGMTDDEVSEVIEAVNEFA